MSDVTDLKVGKFKFDSHRVIPSFRQNCRRKLWLGARESRLASVVIDAGEEERESVAAEDDTLATKGGLDPKLHPISRSLLLLTRPTPTPSSLGSDDHPLITGCPETEFPPLFPPGIPGCHLGRSERAPPAVALPVCWWYFWTVLLLAGRTGVTGPPLRRVLAARSARKMGKTMNGWKRRG